MGTGVSNRGCDSSRNTGLTAPGDAETPSQCGSKDTHNTLQGVCGNLFVLKEKLLEENGTEEQRV